MKLVIGSRDVVALARKTVSEILADNVLGLSAETAYSFFFGLFPTFLFAAPVISFFGNKQQLFDHIFSALAPSLPPDAYNLVKGVLHDVIFAKNAPGLMSIGAALALYAGAGMFSSLMSALNVAYEVHESRPWWEQKLIAIGATVVAAITIGAATTLLLGGGEIVEAVARSLHLGVVGVVLSAVAQYLLVFALLVGSIWGIYMILPDVKDHGKLQTIIGACLATVLWILTTVLFRAYVAHFGSYNRTYGTIGAVIVLLTWMYWSMFAILAGGELNSELRRGTGTAAIKAQGVSVGVQGSGGGRVVTHKGTAQPSSEIG